METTVQLSNVNSFHFENLLQEFDLEFKVQRIRDGEFHTTFFFEDLNEEEMDTVLGLESDCN
jgi:hypothetical protein